ncbi:hypothetical protein FOZ60_006213 [Perkinsus olseni]|uniref:Uncharacterized protein n=1 Tax=Perkinsus olseni TaxID=32597 RepID=A0A7J6NPJ7_PEROL|nr:hypothetical protein FOZ60_006213 [Perkinsus olseni]
MNKKPVDILLGIDYCDVVGSIRYMHKKNDVTRCDAYVTTGEKDAILFDNKKKVGPKKNSEKEPLIYLMHVRPINVLVPIYVRDA